MSDGFALRSGAARADARHGVRTGFAGMGGLDWRDGLRTVLVMVIGLDLLFLPAVATVVGGVSRPFLGFAVWLTAQWLVCVAVQNTALMLLHQRAPGGLRRSRAAMFFAIASIGVVVQFLLPRNPMAIPLGLAIGEHWDAVVGAWTAVPVAGYLVWERDARTRHALLSRRLFGVQQARLRLRRSVVEAQLRAVQARVDPQFLFSVLDAIERHYTHDAGRAEALFDELVVYLRAVLPQAEQSTTSLARELDLAATVVRIHQLAGGNASRLSIGIDARTADRPFPAGVLLPLIRGVLAAPADDRPRTIALTAAGTGPVQTCLRIEVPVAPAAPVLADVQACLRELYGEAASLGRTTTGDGAIVLALKVPHET